MSFKPGDPVWCLIPVGHRLLPSGGWIAASIVAKSPIHPAYSERCWQLDLDNGIWHSFESNLRPRDPPREDLRVMSWDSCLWRPAEVTT